MNRKLHIIVTGEEGNARSFALPKKGLKYLIIAAALTFTVSTYAGIRFSSENVGLRYRVNSLESNVSQVSDKNKELIGEVSHLEEKNRTQIKGAVGELNQRSQVIDSILRTLDIDPGGPQSKIPATSKNSGGPFTSAPEKQCEKLILKVDHTLNTIRPLPLGYPIDGNISSGFGYRIDPILNKRAFHAGLDMVGPLNSHVRATADGKVIKAGYSPSFGWCVKIDHGNGFTTLYGHNQKLLVKRGQRVRRGDEISIMGSTGRSTGPHLHYEVRYKGQAINPIKYLKIAKYISLGPEKKS